MDTAATDASSKPSIPLEDKVVDMDTAATEASSKPSIPLESKAVDMDTAVTDASSKPSIPLESKVVDMDTAATDASSKPSVPLESKAVTKDAAVADDSSKPSIPLADKMADKDTVVTVFSKPLSPRMINIKETDAPAIDILSETSISQKGKNWWTDIPVHDVIHYQRFAYDLAPTTLGTGFAKYDKPVETEKIKASSGTSKVINGEKLFQVELNVDPFEDNELTRKKDGEFLVITGKHGAKKEGGGLVTRSFERHIQLPRECIFDKVKYDYKPGTLTIQALKKEVKPAPVSFVKKDVKPSPNIVPATG